MNITLFILFSIIITIAYFIQGVTGFGSAIFALPLVSIFLPLNTVIPTLLVLSIIQNTMIVIRDKKYINKKNILKIILLILIGVPFGIFSFKVLPENILKLLLSLFIIYFAIYKLIKSNIKNNQKDKISPFDFLYLIFGGCIQGAFGTGGPLIVIYFVKRIHDKKVFRATMCLVWTIINTLIITQKLITGLYTMEVITLIGCGILSVIIGTFLGNNVHDNISPKKFSKVICVILLFSGINLLLLTL